MFASFDYHKTILIVRKFLKMDSQEPKTDPGLRSTYFKVVNVDFGYNLT
jgi:hypothetical protein